MIVKMPPLHRKQDEIRRHDARFKVLSCGRRFGKTMLAATVALACAIQGGAVWWIGPTSREAGIGWKAMRTLCMPIPGAVISKGNKTIQFPSGGWIAVLSAESATLRGEGLDLVVVDEAAFLPTLLNTWQEDLRPALSDRRGSGLFTSTPDGRGDFYQLYQRGSSDDHPDWAAFQCTTYDNPFIPRAEIDAARAELPDWVFRQEYLAEFITFAGKVYKTFDPAGPCVYREREARESDEHWGGIDFGYRNPTVVSVGAVDRDDVLDIVDGLYAREMITEDLVPHLLAMQDKYRVRAFFCDPSEPGTIQTLRRAGVRAMPAPRTTGDVQRHTVRAGIIAVDTRLVQGKLRISHKLPDHIREMDMYRRADGGGEEPLKIDDHAPDSVRYMVVGLERARRTVGNVVVV